MNQKIFIPLFFDRQSFFQEMQQPLPLLSHEQLTEKIRKLEEDNYIVQQAHLHYGGYANLPRELQIECLLKLGVLEFRDPATGNLFYFDNEAVPAAMSLFDDAGREA